MRSLQEIRNLSQDQSVERAAQATVDQIENRVAARGLGTVSNLPPVIKPRPMYDEDGNEVEWFAYGDECGSKPLYGGGF